MHDKNQFSEMTQIKFKNITEVRENIDQVDRRIMELFSERQSLGHEIVNFKTDEASVVAKDRQESMLFIRRKWAEDLGLCPDFFEEIYRKLIDHNIKKELKLLHNKKGGSNE